MVDAGRVIFQVGIDLGSADRAIAELERRFANVGDIDLKIPNSTAANRVAQSVQSAFSGIQIPEFDFNLSTQQLSRSVQDAKAELLTIEQAIENVSRQRIDVDLRVARGTADLARLEAQLQGLQDKRIQVDVNAQAAAAQVRNIDEQIKELTRNAAQLEVEVESAEAQRELIAVNSRIERLEARRVRVQATIDGVDTEAARFEAKIGELEARRIKVEADTGDARAQLSQLERTLDDLGGDNAQQALERLQAELRRTGRAADQADDGLGSVSATLQAFRGAAAFVALDRLVDLFGALASGVANFATETLQIGGAARSAESALTTILGSAEEAQSVLQELNDFAATTPFDLPGIRSAGQQLLAFGFSTNELIPTLEAVGNVAAGVNVPFDELAEIYGKARVQGRLFAEDVNQLTGRGVPIIAEFAAQFGVAESEVRNLVESGQIGFSELEQAFANLTGEGGKFFDLLGTQSGTVVGQISNLGDTVTQFQERLFQAFEPALGAGLEALTVSLDEAASSSEALDILSDAGERLAESLRANPELAERLGQALASLADNSASAFAEILDRIGQALESPENIEAFSQGIENLGQGIAEATSFVIDFLDAVLGLIDGLERLGLASSLVDSVSGDNQSIGAVANQISELDGQRATVGFDGQFDGPLSRLLGLADNGIQIEANVQGIGETAEVDLSFVEAFRQASQEVADNDGRAARRAASERNRANAEAVEEFTKSQTAAISEIERSQSDRIAGVSQNQIAGNISSDEADSQIADIEADSIRERIVLREEEIAQIQRLEQQGALSAEDAAKQISDAKTAQSQLVVESIEQEIDAQDRARQAALDRLSAESQLNSLRAEQVNLQSDLAATALNDQSSLLEAQVSLEQSRLSLSRQNLDAKLAEAEAAEDIIGIEEIRDRILVNQQQSIAAEFASRRQQLQIQQQLAAIDADRQLRLGQIAAAEAEIAVQRARTEGSSQEEIDGLQRIAELRRQETEALDSQARSRGNILALQFEQLSTDEEIANQRALTERREQAIQAFREQQKTLADDQLQAEKDLASETERRERATANIVSALSGLEDISADDALGSLDQLEENARIARRSGALDSDSAGQLQSAIDQAQRLSQGGFDIDEAFRFAQQNENNPFAAGILDQVGLGGVNSLIETQQEIEIADSQIEKLTNGLAEVKAAIEQLPEQIPAGVGTLNVSTPDPVVDAATVASTLNRQQRIAQGVL